jgi:pimeloyl-ACP methyl ester carboxylesterase
MTSGRRVEVLDIPGDSRRRPLVLLHEGLGSVGLWRDFPARLAERTARRVIVYSRHGHGRSEPPLLPRTPSFFHQEAEHVLPDVLRELRIVEPLLVGHSDGGSIALVYGSRAKVTGLVLLAAHVFVEELTVTSIEAIRESFRNGDLRTRMARHHDDPDAAFWGWCDVWLDSAFRTWTLDEEAQAVSAPTLVIQGREDPYGTLAQVERIVSAVGPSAQTLLVPGGHSPHLDATDQVIAGVAAFCSDLA